MSSAPSPIPPDDPKRSLTVAQPDDLPDIGLVGDTYTITVTGEQTAGRFCVIEVTYALGVALSRLEMQQLALARAVPISIGVVILIAGLFQFTSFKARHLACCLQKPECGRTMPADTATAWRHGLRLGLDCSYCCAGLMAILLVMGVMNLGAMAVVAALINVERLAPVTMRVVQAIGVLVIASGSFLIARAAGIA